MNMKFKKLRLSPHSNCLLPHVSIDGKPSISSTLNARILHTNVLSYVFQSQNVTRKNAKKDFCTKNCAFNVDEIDGRLENAVLNPFYRPPRGRWKGSVTMLLYVVLVVANHLIFCFRTVNVLAVDTFSTHKTLQVFWQTIRETQT